MATLTIFPSKLPDYITYKPSSKRITSQPSSVKKNVRFNFTDVPIEKLQTSGVASDSNLQRKAAGDFEATVHDVQASGDNLAGAQAAPSAEKHDSATDTDNGLPSITRFLSPNYKLKLAEERRLRKSILEESNNGALDDNGSHGSWASGSHDEPIILDGDGNLDTQPAPRTLNSGQPSGDAPNLETPPILPNRTANERDSDDDINNDWDDDSETPDPEAVTEPNKPTDPAGHGTWWDIEDGCYVDDDLHPIPPLEQEGLASTPAQYQPHSRHSLGASQDQINLRNNDGARRSAFEEPAPHSLSPTFGEDSGGRRDGNVSELGKDSLLTLQPSTSQIDPEHDQGGPSHGGFKGPGHTTPLHSRGQEEDGPHERQQQEAALEPIENQDSENGDDGEQRREKRRHQEETEEISSGTHQSEDGAHTHNTNGQDDEGPRPAKRRRKLKHLATPVSDEQRDTSRDEGRTLSTFVESTFSSTASTTPGAFEPAPLPEPQLAALVINANQDWEVRKIIGKEEVGGVLHYLVEWTPTLAPEHLLGHAKELVDEFEARLRAQRGAKNGRGGPGLKRGEQAVVEADASGGQQEKRPRGRPRKQT